MVTSDKLSWQAFRLLCAISGNLADSTNALENHKIVDKLLLSKITATEIATLAISRKYDDTIKVVATRFDTIYKLTYVSIDTLVEDLIKGGWLKKL